ncbi:hypothetical protein ACHAWF_005731 [Thalassiosira exigua]
MNRRVILTLISLSGIAAAAAEECVDHPGWRDGASGPGYDCDTYALAQWCTLEGDAGEGWNRDRAFGWGRIGWTGYTGTDDKMYDEACCACGGGTGGVYVEPAYDHTDYVFTAEDKEAARGKKKKRKIAIGEEWVDSYGYSCRVYKAMNFCDSDGSVGEGWDSGAWGNIKSYKNASRNAFQACEVCGWNGQ